MKAQELRLGNLVKDLMTDDYVSVEEIRTDFDEDRYSPIPLTEEWLIKFGFDDGTGYARYMIKVYDKHFKQWLCVDLVGSGNCVSVYSEIDDISIFMDCEHVHQLQNLYFALCGEELTIKQEETTL